MSAPSKDRLSDTGRFCQQMLLAMERQMDREKVKKPQIREANLNSYLELIKDFCDVVAKQFGLTRDEVLQRLGNFAGPNDTMFDEYCIFPSTPSAGSPIQTGSPVVLPTILISAAHQCQESSNPAKKRQEFLQREQSQTLTTLKEQGRKRLRLDIGKVDGSSPQLPGMTDQIEEFFLRRFQNISKPSAICAKVLKTAGRTKALQKLSLVLSLFRNKHLPHFQTTASSAQIWQYLKVSHAMTTAGIYLRRLYMVQLVDRHEQLLEDCETSDSQLNADCGDRTASQAVNHLMEEIFSKDDCGNDTDNEQNRKKVHNYLTVGRKWHRLVSSYSVVIVLLVVTGSELGLNSQNIEHLHEDEIQGLLEGFQQFREPMLTKMCGKLKEYSMSVLQGAPPSYRMKFETFNWKMLDGGDLADKRLLELCEPEKAAD